MKLLAVKFSTVLFTLALLIVIGCFVQEGDNLRQPRAMIG